MAIIFLDYIYWHFTVAPFDILRIMNNYMIARWHQFLIPQHLGNLFAPWHRQNPSDFGKKEKTFGDKIFDSMADVYIRIIAAVIRLVIVVFGLVTEAITFVCFMVLFFVWLAWPAVLLFTILHGISLL